MPPDEQRVWLSPRLIGGFSRLAYQPGGADHVSDDGPIGLSYDALVAYLDASHEVIPFGYDWRRPLEEEAARLAVRVRQALDARKASGQPVRILAHSMGGLLARTMQLVDPATWQRLMAHTEARFVMLGTPNAGSWAPMQVLSGDDTMGNALAALGSPFANTRARSQMAAMPGFLQLQAGLLDTKLSLAQEQTWRKLADDDLAKEQQKNWWQRYSGELMNGVYTWGVPAQAVLTQARTLREKLDAQVATDLKAWTDKVLLVVGHAKATPVGYDVGADGFAYLDAADGDGRVPLASALLPGVRTWTLDCEHGGLPASKASFDAYVDLLTKGSTTRLLPLSASRGVVPGAGLVRSRPSRRPASAQAAGSLEEVFGLAAAADQAGQAGGGSGPLQVTVLNGNLTFIHQPLMLGHYHSLELTGTEGVVDSHLGGAMATALEAGLYPEAPGTQRIFLNTRSDNENPWQMPRPRAAIVIGLGEEGLLDAAQLEFSVCQGTKAWAQREAEEAKVPTASIELAATLIGSGGPGITPAAAARAIAQGVRKANQRLAGTGWPLVSRLTLVEWYLDRATEAWRGLQVLATSTPNTFDIAPTIASGTGPLRRQPESGYRGANYDLISATTGSEGTVSYTLDTRRARTEVRAQRTQPRLLRLLVERAARAADSDPNLGRTLFQLLVPLELAPFLGGTDRVVMQLDDGTAPIPWELLDTQVALDSGGMVTNDEPWAIRTRLLRKLSTSDFRNSPRDANTDAAALVIGEPKVDDPSYPPLPGARAEAEAVRDLLLGPGGLRPDRVTALTDSPEFDVVIGALMAGGPYRIVHVAGHGAPVQRSADGKQVLSRGGVVLSREVFLGPDEIEKLPVVPELVFVNCCHLGGHDASLALSVAEPVAFAAGVADSLIRIGVRCVVAAGWAVDDQPAEVFAVSFYRALLAGRPFIDAVAAARRAARSAAPQSKTWAAYQCYGDPNWVLGQGSGDPQLPARRAAAEGDGIASAPGLALTLDELAVRTRFQAAKDDKGASANRQQAQDRLRALQDQHGARWGGIGAVAEAFGVAWDAAGDRDQAIAWYDRALQANDASASMKVHEQYGNLRVRRAWARASAAAPGSAALGQARKDITSALHDLQAVAALQGTIERHSLCGSAWKRLAQLEARAGDLKQCDAALAKAAQAYTKAEALAAAQSDPQLFYPGLNRMALELVAHAGDAHWAGFDGAASTALHQSLQSKQELDPDFWSSAGLIDFALYEALADAALAERQATLAEGYRMLYARVQAKGYWGSVADQAAFVFEHGLRRASAPDKKAAADLRAELERYAK